MKAVVATSRMHECSRRRTDSCEMPTPTRPHARAAYRRTTRWIIKVSPFPLKRDLSRLKMGPSVPRVPPSTLPINLNLLCSPGPCPLAHPDSRGTQADLRPSEGSSGSPQGAKEELLSGSRGQTQAIAGEHRPTQSQEPQ